MGAPRFHGELVEEHERPPKKKKKISKISKDGNPSLSANPTRMLTANQAGVSYPSTIRCRLSVLITVASIVGLYPAAELLAAKHVYGAPPA